MNRYFAEIAYDGTDFVGWQVQPEGRTVQATIEQALSMILREPIAIVGAGRTDTGVHARCTVAHFDRSEEMSPSVLAQLTEHLNRYLPKDIKIHRIWQVPNDFHARFDAIERCYRYYVTLTKDPFSLKYKTRLSGLYDFDLMNEAAALLIGQHDFTTFSKKHTDVKTHLCVVTHARWEREGETEWVFEIRADRFLRNMVRAIVGTLFWVGKGKISVEQMRQALEARDRSQCGNTAPAEGLFLEKVTYRTL